MHFRFVSQLLPATLRSRWGFDESEWLFFNLVGPQAQHFKTKLGPRMLVQMPQDYFCLVLFSVAVYRLKPSKLTGLWHQSILSAPRGEALSGILKPFRKIARYFDRRKWQRLYGAMGLDGAVDLEPCQRLSATNRKQAQEIFHGLRSKQDLLDLQLDGIHCGDLIYDTYLRYRVQPTVDLRDDYLCHLIARALDALAASRTIFSSESYATFLTSYTSYIQHGIPARVALMMGVDVYSAGNLSQFFKKLSKDDPLHTAAHWLYKEKFTEPHVPADARPQALAMLERRFSGGVDKATFYMKNSAFAPSADTMPPGVEAVVFLHDFFDSPHCHRWMLFPDFLEWARFTLQVIQDHSLPIAIKPHPNQLPESQLVVQLLQEEFPKVNWLSAGLSNRIVLNSGLRCGISVYGTILHELAFHGIPGLAAGDHPHTAFDIAFTPQSVDEYKALLLSFRTLKLSPDVRNEVLAFCYMHNLYDDEGLDFRLDGMGLREIGPNVSSRMGEFLNRHSTFPDLRQIA